MFNHRLFKFIASLLLLSLGTASQVTASPYDHGKITAEDLTEKIYSPFVGRAYPDQVLFGDSHDFGNDQHEAEYGQTL